MSHKKPAFRFAVCISNEDYEASLELHKIYQVIPDEDAEVDGDLRASTRAAKVIFIQRIGLYLLNCLTCSKELWCAQLDLRHALPFFKQQRS